MRRLPSVAAATAVLAVALGLGLAACAPVTPPPAPVPASADPRVFILPDLPVTADAPNVSTQAGMLRVSVRLVNRTAEDIPVVTTTDWVDGQGRPIRSTVSAPRLTVPRFGDAVLDSVAPRSNAAGFRVRVEFDPAAP
ncbi:DUF1425 domain-containing protein [Azospirillum doebereinerae]